MRDTTRAVRFCTTHDGLRLAYASLGQGPPLVRASHFLTHLEHDLASPVWRPWLDELGGYRTLLRYDGRGCGLSDPTDAPLALDDWVADLEAVVDAAGLDRFSLLGCSQGCAVSLAYAVRHPERVACMVMIGGYARGQWHRNPTPEQSRRFQLLIDLVEVGWGSDNPAYRQLYTSLFLPEGTAEQVRWFNELERLSCPPSHAARTMAAFAGIDVSALAERVACPTLVMHARGDARVPFEEGRLLAGLIPGAQFLPLDSPNHVLLGHEPAFAAGFSQVRAFLQRHHPSPASAIDGLTSRERACLELLAQGLDNLQIAAHLGVAEKTVRNKVSALFDKLGVATRAEAIVRARDAGYGRAAPPPGR